MTASITCILAVMMAAHPDALDVFVSNLSSSASVFEYRYEVNDGKTKLTGSGTVEMQDDCYRVEGNGLEIFCDGSSKWTVDRESKEVVIESSDPDNPDYAVNPLLILRQFDQAFSISDPEMDNTDEGKVYSYTLIPDVQSDLAGIKVSISEDGNCLFSAVLTMENGTVMEFTLPSFSFTEQVDSGRFYFDVSTLDDSYVVTDLR